MQIRMYTSPKLRRVSKPIEKITLDVKKLAKKMKRYVEKNPNCVGLAAPQVGKNIRLIAAKLELTEENGVKRTAVRILVNPRIADAGKELKTENESCLSCPGYEIAVARPDRIAVTYEKLSGAKYTLLLVGMQARILQHEIDHLDGVLILDHSSEPLE